MNFTKKINTPKPRICCDINGQADVVNISQWVRRGKMIINRDVLDITDPESVPMQLIALGLKPEDYGYTGKEDIEK